MHYPRVGGFSFPSLSFDSAAARRMEHTCEKENIFNIATEAKQRMSTAAPCMYVCMYVRMYVCMYVCYVVLGAWSMHVKKKLFQHSNRRKTENKHSGTLYVCMYICMCVCVMCSTCAAYVHLYVCMYVCLCVCYVAPAYIHPHNFNTSIHT